MITSDHELKIISELSKNSGASQRELSKVLNLSLGMVNIVLHKLVHKGLMKVQHLDGRKAQYILTPKGVSEKTKKARQYLQRTIDVFTRIKEILKSRMRQLAKEGHGRFYVQGDWEFMHIFDLAVKELKEVEKIDITCQHLKGPQTGLEEGSVLFLSGDPESGLDNKCMKLIDLAELISEKLI